jgi:hypothetical protein
MSAGTTDRTFQELQNTIDVLTARLVNKAALIERLQDECSRMVASNVEFRGVNRELRAEAEQLRAALSWIEDYDPQIVLEARERFAFASKEG